MYQTFKFFIVRAGVSLILFLTLGFTGLFFFHEIAFAGVRFDDSALHWLFSAIMLFFGFVVFGVWGDYRFDKCLSALRDHDTKGNEKEIVNRYVDLIYFTRSSFFLPGKGSQLRGEVIRDYADYLHSMGRDDIRALRVYLKAYLLEPTTSRFRLPLLTALKRAPQPGNEEIDLLLVMFRSGTRWDHALAAHLVNFLIRKNRFSRKTEPVFQAALESSAENARAVISFVLPRLLKKNRLDEFAIRFYLASLKFKPYEENRIKETLATVFCEGNWWAVEPKLHECCREVFESLPTEEKERISQSVKANQVSEKWKRFKLFEAEDFSGLRKLENRFGLNMSGPELLKVTCKLILNFIKTASKKVTLFSLDGLIALSKTSSRTKWSIVTGIAALSMIILVYKNTSEIVSTLPGKRVFSSNKRNNNEIKTFYDREYTLQIAAMTTKKQADRMVSRLWKKRMKGVYVVKSRRRSGGYWFKIRIGRFISKQSAKDFADRLISDRAVKNYFIISYPKDND